MQGKARGRRSSIYVRQLCQRQLFRLGRGVDKHAGKILFVAVLVLATFSVALKSAVFEADVNPLWIEVSFTTTTKKLKKKQNSNFPATFFPLTQILIQNFFFII